MKKTAWLLLSLLIVAALALSACSSDDTDAPPITEEEPVVEEPVVEEPGVAEPKYGGTLRMMGGEPATWDPMSPVAPVYTFPALSRLVTQDWWQGPAGTGEWAFTCPGCEVPEKLFVGDLADSWQIVNPSTIVFNLKEGIMWPGKPGIMESREVTAEDIAWNFEKLLATPGHPFVNAFSGCTQLSSITATDRYTVEFVASPQFGPMADPVRVIGHSNGMVPPEAYADGKNMADWRNITGTGPFMLTDYVSGSVISYEKNPNWHTTDLEGRKLPYVDGLEILIIQDISAQMTAMRSGQIDLISSFFAISWAEAEELQETNPELNYLKKSTASTLPFLQFDMKSPPFGPTEDEDAWKVRRALSMAIDREAIADGYYQGNARIITSTMATDAYGITALDVENLPESSRELYEYNPEKAMELLAEAGYPEGFKTTINVSYQSDQYSILQSFWEAIGVDAEINTMDYGALVAQQWGHTGTGVNLVTWTFGLEIGWRLNMPESGWNMGNFNDLDDTEINEMYAAISDCEAEDLGFEETLEVSTAITLELIDGASEIYLPLANTYNFWQPWVKGYHGEDNVGIFSSYDVAAYIWLDK